MDENQSMNPQRFGRIVVIPGQNGSRYPFCNSLFIDDERKAIIDPGSDEALLNDLASKHRIDVLINSHYHEDHIAFNDLFDHAALWVHEAEAPCHRSYETYLDYYGLKGNPDMKNWHDLLVGHYRYRERSPALEFKDGDILDFGRTRAQVIHTPGHTIGHCSLYFPDDGILFLADMDLTPFGPWYGDRVSDIDQTIDSMHRILKIPADTYITSHQLGILRGDISEIAYRYLDVIDTREARLIKLLDQPRTLKEVVHSWIIYGKKREPSFFFELGEEGMMIKHLERLMRNGRVRKTGEQYSLSP
jgi:glyoxylase-like metal-dependent hydrolase (beta-lactamase superfamily II)